MDQDEERRIIAQVCAGDANAFEALVVAYQKQVYNLALRTVGNEEDAADMTQEVFLRAYRALGTFRGESKFSVWLYRLTTNVCIDFLRELDGLSYAEIGKVLRLEPGTVKSRLFRARRRLCEFLCADGNLPDRYASKQTKEGADA